MGFIVRATQQASAQNLIHEDIPKWSLVFKILVGAVFGVTLLSAVLAAVLLVRGASGGGALPRLFAIFLPVSILLHALMPRRYQIFADRIRIVQGYPFAFDIPIDTIKQARPGSPIDAYGSHRLRFVCSSNGVVHLDRTKGWPIAISPGDRKAFLEKLDAVLTARPQNGKK